MLKHALIIGLALGWAFTSVQLVKARHAARSDARAYMEIQSAYYEGIDEGRRLHALESDGKGLPYGE